MNMNGSTSAMDIVVFLALAFAIVLTIAWSVSPNLRAWIERPKYRFQKNLRSYDETVQMAFEDRNRPKR
jgi:hypothetical protein